MNKDKNQPQNPTPDDAAIAARRRIIKGLAGVPAVMTLSSGAARAATSSLQCIGNPVATSTLNNQNLDCKSQNTPLTQSDLNPAIYYDNTGAEAIPSARKVNPAINGTNDTCVVFVNADGTGETFDGSTPGTTAVTPSCYTSFV